MIITSPESRHRRTLSRFSDLNLQVRNTCRVRAGIDGLDKIQGSLWNVSGEAKVGRGDFAEFEKRIQNVKRQGLTRECRQTVPGSTWRFRARRFGLKPL
jgi:hypothetical protein